MAGHPTLMDGVEVHLVLVVTGGPDILHIGVSKGIMVTFSKMIVPTHSLIATLKTNSKDNHISYLPVSHGMKRWIDECCVVVIKTLVENLGRIRRSGPPAPVADRPQLPRQVRPLLFFVCLVAPVLYAVTNALQRLFNIVTGRCMFWEITS